MGYGNLRNVATTGASETTARQDGPTNLRGVAASHKLAETDLERMKRYKQKISRVGTRHNIDSAIIAGIISRESRAGNALDSNGCGDHGKAFGLMQIDKGASGVQPKGAWDSEDHLDQATGMLIGFINNVGNKSAFQSLSMEKKLKGGIAAYNMGPGNVRSYDRVDENTTGRDYSNDVVARAQYYKDKGF